MKDTLKVLLYTDHSGVEVFGELTLSFKVSAAQRALAESIGIRDAELNNLMEQKAGELRQLLGNTDEV